MAELVTSLYVASPYAELPAQHLGPHWHVVYTSANHEKRVAERLSRRSVENFLPLYSSVRRWRDRRVTLQLPIFPGYLFVRIAPCDRLRVVQIAGVARFVCFNGTPEVLPDEEVTALKRSLELGVRAQPHPYLTVGRRVRIKNGPLAGLRGIVMRWKANWRVVISLDMIQRSLSVDMDSSDLETAVAEKNGRADP